MDGWKVLETIKPLVQPQQMRLLLWGAQPGTGKSSWPLRNFACERVTLHKEMMPDELLYTTELEECNGATRTVRRDGPALRAMKGGKVLVLDEVDQHSPALRCLLHAILDDKGLAGVTLPDGSRIEPAEGFAVVATSNANPGQLAEALRSRFLAIEITAPCDEAIRSLGEIGQMTANHYARTKAAPSVLQFHFRAAAQFAELSRQLPKETAAEIVFGAHAAEVLDSMAALGETK